MAEWGQRHMSASPEHGVGENQRTLSDLESSGLTEEDVHNKWRTASEADLAAAGIHNVPAELQGSPGYIIPYTDIDGRPLSFHRVKLTAPILQSLYPKYKQPPGTPPHVYFPIGRVCVDAGASWDADGSTRTEQSNRHLRPAKSGVQTKTYDWKLAARALGYVIVTEGEKKAECGLKHGFPCVALGGVDSWRTRVMYVTQEAVMEKVKDAVRIKLPPGKMPFDSHQNLATPGKLLAVGMQDFIDFVRNYGLYVIVVFDTDRVKTPIHGRSHAAPKQYKESVQRAASGLAYELTLHGIPSSYIKQVVLPPLPTSNKVGLDDFLVQQTKAEELLDDLITRAIERPNAYPRHPYPKRFTETVLSGKPTRGMSKELAMVILAELDGRGTRMYSEEEGQLYYFDMEEHRLMPVELGTGRGEVPFHEGPFGRYLYRLFGLTANDGKVLGVLASLFTGEGEPQDVSPQRVVAHPVIDGVPCIAVQLSDSHYALISPDNVEILTNGSHGVLFVQGCVDPIDLNKLQQAMKSPRTDARNNWWREVLDQLNFAKPEMLPLINVMVYASPWLNRWNNVQLPIELTTGEAGSGKSSLYSLRLRILTGRPDLKPVPTDVRDWYASISSSGGLHVLDNVQYMSKDLRGRISDELCRLITEPEPHIEMRKLYTTASSLRMKVACTFAMTAIYLPLTNNDLIQRSVCFSLKPIQGAHQTSWDLHNLTHRGGREFWMAHHLKVMNAFLHEAITEGHWDSLGHSKHRLANFEQCLALMSEIIGTRQPETDVVQVLNTATQDTTIGHDAVLLGMRTFAQHRINVGMEKQRFTCTDIVTWASGSEEFFDIDLLSSPRKIGRWLSQNESLVKRVAGIVPNGKYANRMTYIIRDKNRLGES